jgi:Fe2+ transport system protein FeoA
MAPFDGPVLLEIRGMEIALGKGIAERILVEVAACDLP